MDLFSSNECRTCGKKSIFSGFKKWISLPEDDKGKKKKLENFAKSKAIQSPKSNAKNLENFKSNPKLKTINSWDNEINKFFFPMRCATFIFNLFSVLTE